MGFYRLNTECLPEALVLKDLVPIGDGILGSGYFGKL